MEDVLLKKIVSTLLLTFFLLVSVIGSVFNIRLVSSEPRIWIVDDDGPADFHSIQEAINAAGDGDIINVRSGTYYENLVLNKSVALIGENKSATIIDGGGKLYESVLCIRANETMVANFTIQNSGYMAYGIFLEGVQNTTIIRNRIINNQFGIVLFSSYKNIIVENYINGSYFDAVGVWGGSAYNIIANNLISKATHGIYLGSCNYNNIIKNEINKCSLGIYANYIHDATIEGNIIENNGCGMYLVGAGYCPVPKKLINPNYVVNNTIKNNSRGVGFYYATMTYMFYHNNFINNSKQVDTGETPDFSINVWDHGYPSGGNYWR